MRQWLSACRVGVAVVAPAFNGQQHIPNGNNLFTNFIAAATGNYKRHFQQVHHGIWDYDSPNPVPQEIDVDPEQTRVVNRGRIFTPFLTDAVAGANTCRWQALKNEH